jgi:hypothetical protein
LYPRTIQHAPLDIDVIKHKTVMTNSNGSILSQGSSKDRPGQTPSKSEILNQRKTHNLKSFLVTIASSCADHHVSLDADLTLKNG